MLSTSPGLLLISVFTPFTLSCKRFNDRKYLFVSKKWTMINFVLSIVFYLGGSCFTIFYFFYQAPFSSSYPWGSWGTWKWVPQELWNRQFAIPYLQVNLSICLPLFLLSIICYVLLLKCKIRGKPLYKRTAMNIDDWNDIIDLDNVQDGTDLEMGVRKTDKVVIDPSTLAYSPRIVCVPKPFEM